jgi:hypothetical protein
MRNNPNTPLIQERHYHFPEPTYSPSRALRCFGAALVLTVLGSLLIAMAIIANM